MAALPPLAKPSTITLSGFINGGLSTQSFQCIDEDLKLIQANDSTKSYAIRTLWIRWDDVANFTTLLAGGGYFVSGAYAFVPPAQLSLGWPGLCYDTVECSQAGVRSIDGNGVVAGKWAKLAITYRQLNYPAGANAATLEMNFGVECRYIPNTTGKSLLSFPDGTSPTIPIPYKFSTAKISYTLYNCSQVPSDNFQPVMGGTNYPACVNKAPITIKAVSNNGSSYGGTLLCDTGTLLFEGVHTVTRIKNGNYNFDVTYAMSWRQIPWNYELVETGTNAGTWQPLKFTATSNPLYQSVDFLPLLQAI